MSQLDEHNGPGRQMSNKYPPKNRRPNPLLSVITLEIAWKDGSLQLDPNGAAVAAHEESLPLGEPCFASDLSGAPGYEYRTDDITLALARDELYRFLRHDLTPAEFFTLAEKFGVFFEIHDDFYNETTGRALQPYRSAREADIQIATSTTGDWVRVSRKGTVLFEGHRIGPSDLAGLLRTLGHTVHQDWKDPDDF
jgi:hypothetical protein